LREQKQKEFIANCAINLGRRDIDLEKTIGPIKRRIPFCPPLLVLPGKEENCGEKEEEKGYASSILEISL
jgi:hypothetical protein